MTHFTDTNTEGFTQAQLDAMNAEVVAILANEDRDAFDYPEIVKQAELEVFNRYC